MCNQILYRCIHCDVIYNDKIETCNRCGENNCLIEIGKISIEDVAKLIESFRWRCSEQCFEDVADYWDVFEFVKEFIGDDIYSKFEKALKYTKEENTAIKMEKIYFPE